MGNENQQTAVIYALTAVGKAGLVTSNVELSADGKAMNYYQVNPFVIQLSPGYIAEAVKTLTDKQSGQI